MSIIEEAPDDLQSQITYWDTVRKLNAIAHHARTEGYSRLGMQPLPTRATAEYNGRQAIYMLRLLRSLQKSQYAGERWTLRDCSAEVVLNTDPKRLFKKRGTDVDVWFDNNRYNALPYTLWQDIYYEDELTKQWYKVHGQVDYDGLYFNNHLKERVYYNLFAPDADKYGATGTWTVHYDNESIYPPVTSTSRRPPPDEPPNESSLDSSAAEAGPSRKRARGRDTSQTPPRRPAASPNLRRRQRESRSHSRSPRSKRQRPDSTTGGRGGGGGGGRGGGRPGFTGESAPTAAEVGQRHTSVDEKNLTRLQRLQQEARDPPIIIVQGLANSLKCWRNRFSQKHRSLFIAATSVFKWITNGGQHSHRLLVAFRDTSQRQMFLKLVKIPLHCTYTFGSLDSL